MATGLSLHHNKDCIKFFEIDEKNFEKQLAGLTRVKKEVTNLDKFGGVSLQAVLKIMVHPYSFLQLKDPFYIYLHDIKSSDDISRALHTYTWRYKYCYVDKISVPSEASTNSTTTNSTSSQPTASAPQKEIKKHTILKLIDDGKPIAMVVRTTRMGQLFKGFQFGLSFLITLLIYLFIL